MRFPLIVFSIVVGSSTICSSAHALALQCWVGDRATDETAENFSVNTKSKYFEWSGGEASHPTQVKIESLGKEIAIAVIKKPAQQGGKPIADGASSQIFTIFIDKDKKYHIHGDITQDGSCE